MKSFLEWITSSAFSAHPTCLDGDPDCADLQVNSSRYDLCWDEVLMASMHSENAHSFLDHLGPRRR